MDVSEHVIFKLGHAYMQSLLWQVHIHHAVCISVIQLRLSLGTPVVGSIAFAS